MKLPTCKKPTSTERPIKGLRPNFVATRSSRFVFTMTAVETGTDAQPMRLYPPQSVSARFGKSPEKKCNLRGSSAACSMGDARIKIKNSLLTAFLRQKKIGNSDRRSKPKFERIRRRFGTAIYGQTFSFTFNDKDHFRTGDFFFACFFFDRDVFPIGFARDDVRGEDKAACDRAGPVMVSP